VPQAIWDPESSPLEDTPKIRLQATNEDDVEEYEEEGTFINLFIKIIEL
jgi:hypothetical protein